MLQRNLTQLVFWELRRPCRRNQFTTGEDSNQMTIQNIFFQDFVALSAGKNAFFFLTLKFRARWCSIAVLRTEAIAGKGLAEWQNFPGSD